MTHGSSSSSPLGSVRTRLACLAVVQGTPTLAALFGPRALLAALSAALPAPLVALLLLAAIPAPLRVAVGLEQAYTARSVWHARYTRHPKAFSRSSRVFW